MPKTDEGHQHLLIVTELYTRMRFLVPLRRKSQASKALLGFFSHIRAHTGKPVARVGCDNANEFLTKHVFSEGRRQGFRVDLTVPHTPQTNSIAERFNRTLMSRVRATLEAMQLPFKKYWMFCALNTVEKLNCSYQTTVDDVPRARWEQHRTLRSPDPVRLRDLNQFRAFGEYGYIPYLEAFKSKSQNRSTLVRYLATPTTGIFRVLEPTEGQILTCRAADFRPYNPAYDPRRFIAHALPLNEGHKRGVNLHHVLPQMAAHISPPESRLPLVSSLPPPPKSLPAARKHRYAKEWRQAYADEVEKLAQYQTVSPVPR